MNIVVFGAGAIGSVYAAKLSDRHDVTVVARPAHADAIRRHGLRLVGADARVCRVRATSELAPVPDETLVLLTTKVNDNAAAGRALAAAVRPDTVVLCVQNGLHGEQIVKDAIRDRCPVLRGITQFGAIFREPGVVDLKVHGCTLIERHERSAALARLLSDSGLDGRVSENIDADMWRKLIFNCVINPITAMLRTEVGGIADTRLDPLKQLVIDECVAVARADGVMLDVDFQQLLRDQFGPSRNIASMRQDLMKRKRTEIDFMNGAVVDLGRRLAVDCPVNAALVAIIKAMEQ